MSSLAQAAWPSQPIPEQVKELLAKFYACVDSPLELNSNVVLADQVFHSNGSLQFNKRHVRGRDKIANWRDSAGGSDGVVKSAHTVREVYSLSADGNHVLTTGTLAVEMADGRKADSEFACRCLVTHEGEKGAVIKEARVWIDYVPFLDQRMFDKAKQYPAEGER
nr:hypothetical protein B0A51_18176 [Rachicladosporium sp. CCFEE 5018]